MLRTPAKHCRNCGTAVQLRLPDDGDTRPRAVCPACLTVHYDNPLNVVGTVPVWGAEGEYVLLCKRNIEPRRGKWTLPAGFMELGETTAEGASRETDEEAGAKFELGDIFTLMNVARVGQLHIYYRARLLSDRFDPGHETMEARLFTEEQ
ncbi:MAG: NUDIX hydrolase, partial [Chitinophagaceae bacterium]